jgi:predicted ABC-type transport system involved in lysophospholipase L1 biosynthesis ATPase subunit
LTVLENVLVPTLVGIGDEAARHRALELIERVGLSDRLDHRPAELSGGERQRVALARALICCPLLLLCDEPTGNLDRQSADAVADLIFRLHRQQETILVIVTHNVELASRCATRFRLGDRRLEKI